MHDVQVVLADHPGFGRIRLCECDSIHVSVGPVTLNLEPTAFLQLATLICLAVERLSEVRKSCEAEADPFQMPGSTQSQLTH